MLCLSGDASPSVAVVVSARRRYHLPSQQFSRNRDASAPKRFRHCFAFLSLVTLLLPSPRSLSLPSPIHPSRWVRRNRNASSFVTLSATFHPSATLHPLRRFWWCFSSQRFQVFFFFFPFELILVSKHLMLIFLLNVNLFFPFCFVLFCFVFFFFFLFEICSLWWDCLSLFFCLKKKILGFCLDDLGQ